MSRKICIVTGTRAEYGLLKPVMEAVREHSALELQVIATGAHLSAAHGMTVDEITRDSIAITRKVDLELGADTPVDVARSMGIGMREFARAFEELSPDIVLLLGDRYEIFAAASAAMLLRIPLAHIHGGESTEGAIDEAMRHAISKMAQIHYVAAEPYRKRVIQLGEQPANVHLVGGLGIDAIARTQRLDKKALEQKIDFTFGPTNFLVTFHPVTLENATAAAQMQELLAALKNFPDAHVIFTMPNADPGSRALFDAINAHVAQHKNTKVYTSLGHVNYVSALPLVDAVIGNSSSGLIEAPCFNTATVNIGDRQTGRLKAASVIDCAPTREAITAAITKALSKDFRATLKDVVNPYGAPGAAQKIVQHLASVKLDGILKKRFYDLP